MTRLVIFTTHPIQYQAPWFRALAADDGLNVEVVYSYVPDAAQQGIGFGEAFQWDVPLLTGYPHRVLATTRLPSPVPAFAQRWARGIAVALDEIRPDVAMVLGWQEISLVQALLACRRRGIPVILRGESNVLRPRPALVSAVHRRYFRLCDAFLAIGRANADLYRAAGVREERIITAGYFVDNNRFAAGAAALAGTRTDIRRTWSIPQDAVCFAFVGKLEPKKCPLDFLNALALARDRLNSARGAGGASIAGLVVGSGVELEAAKRLVAESGLPVTFAGFLNQGQISRAYVAADALVLPSDLGETWGLVVNEAMASSRPAIVSDRIGAANDLVLHGKTGLVVPHGNVAALAGAMVKLACNPGLTRALGDIAHCRVREHYSIELAVERTHQAIKLAAKARYAPT